MRWIEAALYGLVIGYAVVRPLRPMLDKAKRQGWKSLTVRHGTNPPRYGWILFIFVFLSFPFWGSYLLAPLFHGTAAISFAQRHDMRGILSFAVVVPAMCLVAWVWLRERREIQAGVQRNQDRPQLVVPDHELRLRQDGKEPARR